MMTRWYLGGSQVVPAGGSRWFRVSRTTYASLIRAGQRHDQNVPRAGARAHTPSERVLREPLRGPSGLPSYGKKGS